MVKLGKEKINISPIELQIAYKIYLGSDKDYEDARYLYLLCMLSLLPYYQFIYLSKHINTFL